MQLNPHIVSSEDGAQHQLLLSESGNNHQRPVIVCLPAMGVPARKYLPLSQALAEQGIASGILEWRGIETSSLRASRRENFGYHEILNLDIPAAMACVRAHFPYNPCYLLGHSLGGQLGMIYMTQNPQQIAGHIGIATGLPYYRQWPFPKNIGLWSASWLMRSIAAVVGHYPGRKLGFAGREARQVVNDWAYSVVTGEYRVAGKLLSIAESEARRSLMITIEKDLFAPPESTRHLGEKLSLSPVTYQHLTEADFVEDSLGHFNWMKEPQPIVKSIERWLQESITTL